MQASLEETVNINITIILLNSNIFITAQHPCHTGLCKVFFFPFISMLYFCLSLSLNKFRGISPSSFSLTVSVSSPQEGCHEFNCRQVTRSLEKQN